MAQITFPSNIMLASQAFARDHLHDNLSGKNIERLNLQDKKSIDANLRKTASSEYKKYIRNTLLTTVVAIALFSTFLSLPFATFVIASKLSISLTLNATLTISASAITWLFFYIIDKPYDDFTTAYVNIYKHNNDALIHAANKVKKRTNIPPVRLPEEDKKNILAMLKEIETRNIPSRNKLTELGQKIMVSAQTNNTFPETLAFVFTDEKAVESVEKIIQSFIMKRFIIMGLNHMITIRSAQATINETIPRFARLVRQDEAKIKQLIETRDWNGIFDLLIVNMI